MSEITRHIQSEKGARSGGTAYPFSRAMLLAVMILVIGCSIFGGVKPEANPKLDIALKRMDKITKDIENNSGSIVDMKQDILEIHNTINNIQNTTTNETPFWKIALSVLPYFVIYLVWRLIRAKVAVGSTVKNFLFGA